MQVDRSAPWGRGNQEASSAASHFPGQFPGLPGQMAQGIGTTQTGRPEAPVSVCNCILEHLFMCPMFYSFFPQNEPFT
jgi:hypothetical protein